MLPLFKLVDTNRQLPLRNLAKKINEIQLNNEPIAMIGLRKPSLHYYTKKIIFYEQNTAEGIINLSQRLIFDRRKYYADKPNYDSKTLLIVIDEYSSRKKYWSNIIHQELEYYGIYKLWRIKKNNLDNYSSLLIKKGYKSDWENKNKNYERL